MFISILRCVSRFSSPLRQSRVEIKLTCGGSASLNLEVAHTMLQRSLGLMGHAMIPPDGGMLFIYPWPRTVRIWMANTPRSLDVIFVSTTGEVVKVVHQLKPFSRQWVSSGQPVNQVIEIAGGMAEQLAITAGAQVRVLGEATL